MKRAKILLAIMIVLASVISLASCEMLDSILANIPGFSDQTGDGGEDEGGENDDEGKDEGDKVELDGLILIENGKANFRIVQASTNGAPLRAKAFVDRLAELGITVEKPVSDRDASAVADCEIIFGADISNREGCDIDSKYLGSDGYMITVVGNKVVVAGGSEKALSKAYDIFMSQVLKINARTKKGDIDNLAVKLEKDIVKLTDYLIDTITVAGNDLRDYVLVINTPDVEYELENVKAFRNKLYTESGYWLETGDYASLDSYAHKLVISYTKEITNDGGDGFVGYVDENGDFYIECAYANSFNAAFAKFTESVIFGKMGNVIISDDFKQTEVVSRVYYSDFGAVGDGKTDDFKAILDTHLFANDGGQKVMGDYGAKYYIGDTFDREIPVRTDTDFNTATFIINDKGDTAYENRNLGFFQIAREYSQVNYNKAQIEELCGAGHTISLTDRELPWITPLLDGKSLVRVINGNHRDFIRHGANENSGSTRRDTYVINPDGTLEEDVPIAFEFTEITKIEVNRVDDNPITIENGFFEHLCCETVAKTNFAVKYHAYYRGIKIYRPNTTLKNIKHTMKEEPTLNVFGTKDKMGDTKVGASTYGTRDESYPYYGFFYVQQTYNTHIQDCIIDGHTTYYEDKPFTASTGSVPNPVPAGSYDLIVENSSRTYLKNVVQQDNEYTGLGDQRYWGIMSSNFNKNIHFEDCKINRYDAHQGFWNATLKNTTIGHSFNVVGGGYLYCENVTKITGSAFISHRGDYGATFDGDITLINCEHVAMRSYYSNQATPGKEDYDNLYDSSVIISSGFSTSNSGAVVYKTDSNGNTVKDENGEPIIEKEGRYWYWDFGYTCYMPRNIILDNFKSGAKTAYVFNQLPDIVFGDIPNQYQLTESITYRNMSPLDVCASKIDYKKLMSIPVTVE